MKGTKLASEIKFYLDYSKWVESKQRPETWEESIERIMNMHKENPKLKKAFEIPKFLEMFETTKKLYEKKHIGGSMRALQFGGEPIMKHNSKMFNCLYSHCDRVTFFEECSYWLLSGCGVGFSVQKHHVNQLPPLQKRKNDVIPFIVPDSIEGWSEAFGRLLKSFFDGSERIVFDLSQIRPKGAHIKGGFKAPGSEGLRKALEKIEQLLEQHIQKRGGNEFTLLSPIVCYDTVMFIADAVLSGGVRRSATICLFSLDDDEMMKAKTFENFNTFAGINPQRGRSNNSVILHRKDCTKEQFMGIFSSIRQMGEPGFYFVDDYNQGTNPCVSGDTWVTTTEGPKQVKDIIGKQVELSMNGKFYKTTSDGFWETGEKEVFEIELYHGERIKTTKEHKFLLKNGSWCTVEDLQIGDELCIETNKTELQWEGIQGTKEEGWLVGNLIGDGTFSDGTPTFCYWGDNKQEMLRKAKSFLREVVSIPKRNVNREYLPDTDGSVDEYHDNVQVYCSRFTPFVEKWKIERGQKHFNTLIEQGSPEFYSGVIGGFFDADGSVGGNSEVGLSVGITQSHRETLEIVQRMLLRLGICSRVHLSQPEGPNIMPDGKGGEKEYIGRDCYELVVQGRVMVEKFFEKIFVQDTLKLQKFQKALSTYKTNRLYKANREFSSKVLSIKSIGVEKVYDCTVPEVSCFGANGFIAHNCVEISLWGYTEDMRSGFQGCNLSTINGNKMTTKEKFFEACVASAFIGTLQATYTDFKFVSKESKEIFDREALLGCSVTGWMNNPQILLDEEVMREGARIVKETNKLVVDMMKSVGIDINYAARTTCVKPEGNSSVLFETASGVHGEHSRRYFRVMQINKDSEITKILQETFPELIEESAWSSNKTDIVVYIPTEPRTTSIFKDELEGIKQLEIVKKIQTNWVIEGTNVEHCVKPFLKHNVSNTVEVREEQWNEVIEYLWENKDYFTGVSFLPKIGDKMYYQAPFTSVLTVEEIVEKYGEGSLFASGLIVDGLHVFENLWDACDLVLKRDRKLEGTRQQILLRLDWIRRAKQYAKRYFKNDLQEMTYCLKDVHLYHKWCTINRVLSIRDLDFTQLDLKPNYVDADSLGAISCQGGACELPEGFGESNKK